MQRLALASAAIMGLMSEAVAGPQPPPPSLDTSQGIATDLSFIEQQVSKTLSSLGSTPPANPLYPVSGGDRRTVEDDKPFGHRPRMDKRIFSGPALASLIRRPGRRRGATQRSMDRPAGHAGRVDHPFAAHPTDIGFIFGTSFGNGYRLTGDPTYKQVLNTTGASLASLYNSKVGAVQSWSFPQYHFPVIIDSMMTLGPLQWGAC